MSWLSSVFTAPGQNAANTDRDRKSTVQRGARDAFNELNPTLLRQSKFAAELEPNRERNVRGLIDSTSAWGVQTGIDNARRGIMSGAMQGLPTLRMLLGASGGGGIGAEQGMVANAFNTANMRGNDLQAFWSSPEGQRARYMLANEAITGAQVPSILQAIGPLAEIIYGRPAPQVGASPLAQIAGLGSTLLSAGAFPGLMGGMGGAAGGSLAGGSLAGMAGGFNQSAQGMNPFGFLTSGRWGGF